MKDTYVYLSLGHPSFNTGKIAIVAVHDKCEFLATYRDLAKEKVCEEMGIAKEEIVILDYSVLGRDVLFIK